MGVIAKQSIRSTVITYIGVGVGFLTTFFVLTRFLTAEEIGLARVLTDTATLFISLAQLGTTSSIIRFYPYFKTNTGQNDYSDHGFFFWTILIPLAGFCLFTLVYILLQDPIADYFGEKSALFVDYYRFVLPMAFFMLYQTIFETNANVRMRIVVPRAVRELLTRIGLLVVYLLYAYRIIDLDGFVVALCSVYAVAALCNIVYLFSFGNISLRPDISFLRQNRKLVRNYLFYTLFLLFSTIVSAFAPYLGSYIISARQGLSDTGIYAIATYIAVMVSIPYRSLNAIASPELAAATKENDREHISRLTKQVSNNLFLIGSFILLLIWVNIDLIFHILPNGEVYAVAKHAILLLALCQLLIATFNICLNTLNYSKYYYLSLLLALILTILSAWLNNSFIPELGISGAAFATLSAYSVYFLLLLLVIAFCTHTTPLSSNMLKTLIIIATVMTLNHFLLSVCADMNIWVSSILRTAVLICPALIAAYFWHISDDINSMIKKR